MTEIINEKISKGTGNSTSQSERIMEFVRAIVRPIITIGTLAATFYVIIFIQNIPDRVFTWMTVQSAILITWWFADRSRKE